MYKFTKTTWTMFVTDLFCVQSKNSCIPGHNPDWWLGKTTVDVRAWMSDYIPYMAMGEIPCPNLSLYLLVNEAQVAVLADDDRQSWTFLLTDIDFNTELCRREGPHFAAPTPLFSTVSSQ